MGKTKRERFIWEEISDIPCIYKISRADSEDNSYLIVESGEALIVDPRSEKMLESICRLARGLGAQQDKIQAYLTRSGSESGRTTMGCVPCEMTLYCRKEADTHSIWPAQSTLPEEPLRAWTDVRDGDSISIGEERLHVINMEGCVREQTGLWIPEHGILFAGDAIRCGRAPDIRDWDSAIDMLSLQIEMLRRVRRLSVQCILPGRGPCSGVDELSGDRNAGNGRPEKISPECLDVLDSMLEQYCVRILEVYQKIPAKGLIPEEELIAVIPEEEFIVKEDSPEFSCAESCLRYLLYRKYILRHVLDNGIFYERGSLRLTDWTLGFGS